MERRPSSEADRSLATREIPPFCGTRKFITSYTRARHLSLFWATSIQSMPHPTSLTSILILPSHLRLGLSSGYFPQISPTETLYATLLFTYALCALSISMLMLYRMVSPAPRLLCLVRNMVKFLRWGVSTSSIPQAVGPPLVGCPRLLI